MFLGLAKDLHSFTTHQGLRKSFALSWLPTPHQEIVTSASKPHFTYKFRRFRDTKNPGEGPVACDSQRSELIRPQKQWHKRPNSATDKLRRKEKWKSVHQCVHCVWAEGHSYQRGNKILMTVSTGHLWLKLAHCDLFTLRPLRVGTDLALSSWPWTALKGSPFKGTSEGQIT